MPSLPEGADNWVIALIVITWALVQYFATRKNCSKINDIHEQAVNSHLSKSNLRDDVDELKTSSRETHALLVKIDARTERMGHEIRVNKELHTELAEDTYEALAKIEHCKSKAQK